MSGLGDTVEERLDGLADGYDMYHYNNYDCESVKVIRMNE